MQVITQMLLNNAGQRLTTELINGMAHTIKTEFLKMESELNELRARLDEQSGQHDDVEESVDVA